MKTRNLYLLWLGLYILCAGLGLIQIRNAFIHILLGIFALAFYLPAILLLHQAITKGHKKSLLCVRYISLASLVLTLILFVANILCVYASETVGKLLDALLHLVSVPMFCCYWRIFGLFLWSCLFMGSFPKLWKN